MSQNRFIPALIVTMLVAVPGAIAQTEAAELKLPVPRTFDLTHVEPGHFAAALGKDPTRIFEFVRDNIAYEAYTGVLRGPRGTLLAMAGNSVDRAALLASLLEQSGQKIRFAHGTLPEARARDLVNSMWIERPRRLPEDPNSTPPPAMKAAWDMLVAGVKRDYELIRGHLKKTNVTPSRDSAPTIDSLIKEAQQHYWVQWMKDGAWTDLDPSFRDGSPGRRYTPNVQTSESLSDSLYHRVEIRVRLEEYAADKPATGVILTHGAKAADLSGKDVILIHQPENWTGPATSLESAIASAIANTGRVKPILIVGDEFFAGKRSFRTKPPASVGGGLGSIGDMLSGAGTRRAVPIATAETIEVDFISPGGRKETVTREIYDLVGKARRVAGKSLSADEVKKPTEAADAPQVVNSTFGLFLTTGGIDVGHLPTRVQGGSPDEPADMRAVLRQMNIAFTTISDGFLKRLGEPQSAVVMFYPDSPRLQIMEISKLANGTRLSLDLRRFDERAIVMGPHPEAIVNARILKGVMQGTLERVLVESSIRDGGAELQASVSTSALFERAIAEQVPLLILPRDVDKLQHAPPDALARVREETAAEGVLALVPQRAVTIAGLPRLAWWRINARSGETEAVTDDGLHQEYVLVHRQGKRLTLMDARMQVTRVTFHSARVAADMVEWLLSQGTRYGQPPFFPPGIH